MVQNVCFEPANTLHGSVPDLLGLYKLLRQRIQRFPVPESIFDRHVVGGVEKDGACVVVEHGNRQVQGGQRSLPFRAACSEHGAVDLTLLYLKIEDAIGRRIEHAVEELVLQLAPQVKQELPAEVHVADGILDLVDGGQAVRL